MIEVEGQKSVHGNEREREKEEDEIPRTGDTIREERESGSSSSLGSLFDVIEGLMDCVRLYSNVLLSL